MEGSDGVPELWSSDGSPGGTARIRRFDEYVRRSGDNISYLKNLTDANGIAFFTFDDQEHGNELWMSDGTEAGTRLVKDIREGNANGLSGGAILADGGVVYFSSTDGQLWRSDGTADGTHQVAVIPEPSSITELHAVIDGIVYFNVRNSELGHELFRSDGTPEGTWLVKDIQPGPAFGSPREMVEWNGLAYFVANERDDGGEVWRTDGTPEGTWQVTDVVAGPSGPIVSELTPVGDRLYFIVEDQRGRRLWQTGGSFESTSPVTTYQFPAVGATEPLPPWSNPDSLIGLNSMLIFTGDTVGIGNEPWRINQDGDSNSAPILEDGTAVALGTISEDPSSNAGLLLADLLRGQDGGPFIADNDANSIVGIAVIGADNTDGRWQFTLDAGNHWFDFGSTSESAARVLVADYRTRMRFMPNRDFAGAVNGGLHFRAWDATTGVAGGTADATSFGGTTAFSEGVGTASITIDEVNDAPTALDDVLTVRQGILSVVIDVLLNDSVTPDFGETITLTSLTQPAQGGVAAILENRIELTVAELFLGDMEFSYTITDSRGASASGNVVVRVALRGDANFDGRVDLLDLNAVRNGFGGAGFGDVNDDGAINLNDLNDVRNHFGDSVPAAVSRGSRVSQRETNTSIAHATDLVFEMLVNDRRGAHPVRRLKS